MAQSRSPSRQQTDSSNGDSQSSTARHGGSRLPRRVQWASKDDVRLSIDPEALSRSSMHALDELGLDPGAFENLRGALERHRSETSSARGRGTLSLTQPLPSRPSLPPQSSATQNGNPISTPAPSHRFLPSSSTDTDRLVTVESPSTETGTNTSIADSPLLVQSTHSVPGEAEGLPVDATPLGLTLGVDGGEARTTRRNTGRRFSMRTSATIVDPAMERHIERLAVHRAAGVVRAHTRRRAHWIHRPHFGMQGSREQEEDTGAVEESVQNSENCLDHSDLQNGAEADWTDFKASRHTDRNRNTMRKKVPAWFRSFSTSTHFDTVDPEASTESMHALHRYPRLGNGVLSALLTLYGREHDHDREHDDEGSASGGSTPGRRSRSNSIAESEDEVSKLEEPERPWIDRSETTGKNTESEVSASSHEGTSKPSQPTKPLGRSLKTSSASSLLQALHHRTHSLPTSSPTAALIAGAGALTGAAVPSGATLAPDLRRGEGLVRYEIDREGADTTEESTSRTSDTVVPPPVSAETSQTNSYSPTSASTSPVGAGERSTGINRGWKTVLRDLPLPSPGVVGGLLKGVSRSLPGTPHRGVEGSEWAASSESTTPWSSGDATPRTIGGDGSLMTESPGEGLKGEDRKDYFGEEWEEMQMKKKSRETRKGKEMHEEQERKRQSRREKREKEKEKRQKRKKAEVWITRHVAAILQRQEFILKLARAMMMFGGPSHRFVAQIQSTGRVLDVDLSCMYLPDVMLISFEDRATGTSNVKFIRQESALNLEKLGEAHVLYWNVIHDNMSVSQASAALDVLMRKKPLYNFGQLVLIGGMCSASICSVSFSGSFIDCLVSAPLGGLLVAIQLLSPRNELYGNVFEITISTLMSFLSAVLASTKHFCYPAVTSSSVVLILPGFIVLCGSLEICSRSLVAGAVRLCFALMYSLFLGFGLGIGAQLYVSLVGKQIVGPEDYTCLDSHDPLGPWWQQTPSLWWAFLTVPMYSLFLSMRLMAPWWKRELLFSIVVSSMGWVTNHFTSLKFPNQGDISAAVGAFVVGFITGILFQVPSGLGSSGLLNFVYDQASGSSSSYESGFQTALQLISVAIGLTVGLGISLVVVHPIQSRRRAGGIFSL
ncbi:hypothetical protein EDD16DRAFT_1640690 [Pisolithus croceorrhizus]|nr:hypothetical protein EDD16DRAFT_1640690 [Pisolithus croceorrhizus]